MQPLPLQKSHSFRYQHVWQNTNQCMHMITVDRSRIDDYFLAVHYFSKQLSASQSSVTTQYLITIRWTPASSGVFNPRSCGFHVLGFAFPKHNVRSQPPEDGGIYESPIGNFKKSTYSMLVSVCFGLLFTPIQIESCWCSSQITS